MKTIFVNTIIILTLFSSCKKKDDPEPSSNKRVSPKMKGIFTISNGSTLTYKIIEEDSVRQIIYNTSTDPRTLTYSSTRFITWNSDSTKITDNAMMTYTFFISADDDSIALKTQPFGSDAFGVTKWGIEK